MFRLVTSGNLSYYVIDEFEETGLVKHCFTTRRGGVSKNEFESMNLRLNCGDSQENIIKNYRIICDEIGVNFHDLVFSKQTHSDTIYMAEKKHCGTGFEKPAMWDSCDGLITNQRAVPIIVFSADCVPVFLLDTENRAIGLVHSGWRGTVSRISQKAVEKMREAFGTKPENVIAAIGPSIRVCHFEVGDEVAEEFRKEFGDGVLEKREKYHVNMQKAIELQLKSIGTGRVIDSGICTYCQSGLLFSHRKTQGKRGVMGAIMELK